MKKNAYHGRHLLRLFLQGPQFVPNIEMWAVEEHVQDSVRGTGVVAQLVREPDALSSGVVKVCRAMSIFAPEETEDEAVRVEVVHRPGLDVVHFDQLDVAYPEFAR